MNSKRLSLALAAGSLAVAVLAGTLMPTGGRAGFAGAADPTSTTTTTVTRACPTFTAATASVRLAAWAPDAGLQTAPLADPADRTPVTDVVRDAPAEVVRLVATAGTLFAGTVGTAATDGAERGLSLTPCTAAWNEAWFVGVRSHADAQAEVQLVNLDTTDAEVNLTIHGSTGRLNAAGSRGIVVAAQSRRTVSLGPLVDSTEPVTVQVETTQGRVASVVRERLWSGGTPQAADWIGSSADPAEQVVIAGLPAGEGARLLVVANPGDRVASVSIDVLGSGGSHRLVGAERLEVPPGSTRTLALDAGLAGEAASLRLTSNRPVTASVESRATLDPASDWVVQPSGTALTTGAVTVLPLPSGGASSVTVANPTEAEISAVVVARGADGAELARHELTVAASSSVTVEPVAGEDVRWEVTDGDPGLVAGATATATLGDRPTLAAVGLTDAAASGWSAVVTYDPNAGI